MSLALTWGWQMELLLGGHLLCARCQLLPKDLPGRGCCLLPQVRTLGAEKPGNC